MHKLCSLCLTHCFPGTSPRLLRSLCGPLGYWMWAADWIPDGGCSPEEPTQGYLVLPGRGGACEAFPARGIHPRSANCPQSCGLTVGATAGAIWGVLKVPTGLGSCWSDELLSDLGDSQGPECFCRAWGRRLWGVFFSFTCSNLTPVCSAQKIKSGWDKRHDHSFSAWAVQHPAKPGRGIRPSVLLRYWSSRLLRVCSSHNLWA